jgi:hypothetical protein
MVINLDAKSQIGKSARAIEMLVVFDPTLKRSLTME